MTEEQANAQESSANNTTTAETSTIATEAKAAAISSATTVAIEKETAQEEKKPIRFDYALAIAGGDIELAESYRSMNNFPRHDAVIEEIEKQGFSQEQADYISSIVKNSSKLASHISDLRIKDAERSRSEEFSRSLKEEFGNTGATSAMEVLKEWSKEIGMDIDTVQKTVSSDVLINIVKNKLSNKFDATSKALQKINPPTPGREASLSEEEKNIFDSFRKARNTGRL